jgi:hypothetical protein
MPKPLHALGALVGGAIVAFFLTLANRYTGFFINLPAPHSTAGHLCSLLYLAALLAALLWLARGAAQLRQSTPFLLLVGLACALPMGGVLLANYWHFPSSLVLSLTANNLFLPIGAVLVGSAVGRIIKHPNTLLAAAGFAIFFDLVVVGMGTVAQVLKSNSNIISAVSVGAGGTVPAFPGARSVNLVSGVTIGPADVLFLAVFLAAVAQLPRLKPEWALSLSRTVVWMYGLLFAALVLVETTNLPVPALVPMGLSVLIANARHGAFTKQEKRDLWIGAVFALLCAVGIVAYGKFFAEKAAQSAPKERTPRWGWQTSIVRETGERVVTGILPEMPIEKAGIQPGDVIESVNGVKTNTLFRAEDWQKAMDAGEKTGLEIRLRRLGEKKPLDVKVTLP